MSDPELPTVITAIANPEIESFVAGTLYAQGWSVIFRAIDSEALESFIKSSPESACGAIVIFAPDLSGITHERMDAITPKVKQLIGFSNTPSKDPSFGELHAMPITSTDLISLVRGYIRAPLLRQNTQLSRQARRSHVLAVGSAGSYTGCTTLAINIAMELSIIEKATLLIDANFRAPSIAALLSVRNVQSEAGWRSIAPSLCITEISQEQALSLDTFMNQATQSFDHIIIDLGSISGLSNRLTDRRWTSTMTTWSCDQGDELMVIARPDVLGLHRLEQVASLIQKTSIRTALSFTLNMRSQGRKGSQEEAKFHAVTTPLHPRKLRVIPRDTRAITAAQAQKSTLIEVNERSGLRKSIAAIASELVC